MESNARPMCPRCGEMMDEAEKCIREHPGEAVLTCLGAGFLLAHLPLRLLMCALTRVVVVFLKPALLFYGIYRLAEDLHARRLAQAAEARKEADVEI